MPKDETSRPPAEEEFDPNQTVFFKRRKRSVNFLPLIVIGALVLGSGALITWAVSQSRKKPLDEADPSALAATSYANRKLLSPAEAKALENPPVQPAQSLPPLEEPTATPEAAASVPFDPAKPVRAAMPVGTGDSAPPDVGAASGADAAGPLNFDPGYKRNADTKEEVLRRIDLMPGVSPVNKDKLYASVDHARGMGRVLTISFEKGESAVRASEVERIKQQVQTPQIKQLVDDPTVVFVILGYADQKGNEKINSEVSLSRARSVMDALRDKCGFQNVMHSVAMGGSNLFSEQQTEKNRVAEIWAVLP